MRKANLEFTYKYSAIPSRQDAQVSGMLSTALSLRPQGQESSTEEQGVRVNLPTAVLSNLSSHRLFTTRLPQILLKLTATNPQATPAHSREVSLQTSVYFCVVYPV